MGTVNSTQYKTLNRLVLAVSIVLPVVVAILFRVEVDINWPFSPYLLPKINAVLNGTTAMLLLAALFFIKRRDIKTHSRLIYIAMLLSVVFLVIYVLYHISTGHTVYGGTGTIKTVYLTLLLTHIALAIIQPPLVLYAFLYAYTGRYEKHKKLVRYAFPVWLYVSVTGVICYLMISPYYDIVN